jgi:low affinity Fe/Cu permease
LAQARGHGKEQIPRRHVFPAGGPETEEEIEPMAMTKQAPTSPRHKHDVTRNGSRNGNAGPHPGRTSGANGGVNNRQWFDSFARAAASFCGKPTVFLIAVAIVVIWAASGSFFHWSDTWQLVINTGTTIVTFLMVFLIQNTQNRDALAIQVKLSELIIALKGADNHIANVENLNEEELEEVRRIQQAAATIASSKVRKDQPIAP